MRLLARREHSILELTRKLKHRGFPADEIGRALESFSAEGWLSDRRFAESFVRYRVSRGLGPVRIRRELSERGVDRELADAALTACDEDWLTRAEAVRQKRFGAALPRDIQERGRQVRFLAYRGFPQEQIGRVLRGIDD
jgi:regulatory protein